MKTQNFADEEEITLISLAQKYSDDEQARALLESWRWPDGPHCPRCGCKEAYKIISNPKSRTQVRKGLYKCKDCRKPFTVTVNTIFEDSHIGLGKWLMAFFIVSSAKKGISSHQLHRMLNITYKTAWFMSYRIRYAMTQNGDIGLLKGTVECDETYVGGKGTMKTRAKRKTPVVALVERDGDVRTKVIPKVNRKNLRNFLGENAESQSTLNTDEFVSYKYAAHHFDRHDSVNHSKKEYARHNPDGTASHVNSCESFFSLIKRGVYGAFHHVSREHLHRYCNEFAFRWNTRKLTDGERTKRALEMIYGKRLTYRQAV